MKDRAHRVDQFVYQFGRDQRAAQRMTWHFGGKRSGDRPQEVRPQEPLDHVGLIHQLSGLQPLGQIELGVGAEHRQFRPHQARIAP